MPSFEDLCFFASDNGIFTDYLYSNYATESAIKFRYAFSRMSQSIDFEYTDEVVKTSSGFIGKDNKHMPLHMLNRLPKYRLYLPKIYTDDLRLKNIEICLDADLERIMMLTSVEHCLQYVDVVCDLLYFPSDRYQKLVENWALQLMDLAMPTSLTYKRLKEDVLPVSRKTGSYYGLNWYPVSAYPIDFKRY